MSDGIERPPAGEDHEPADAYSRIVDQVADLLQTAADWLRQEAEATVREKIVPPLQQLGITIASASAAAALLVVGLLFIAVAVIMALGNWLGYVWAFLIVGAAFLAGSGAFLAMKTRSMQHDA